ncbi:SURF1 family protein [Nocardioides sp.]|uniref:SURF1 family cytochrome oxidase biogenesis protein n=1 Tax=Nocardioides sp. TaxID=35761 RepID=UPI00260FAD32|nr:SURF1 family protein [Nocardioides sp.]
MGRLRFLFSRRWILFFLAVVVISWATWWLGNWQFGRLTDRKESNSIVRTNESQTATPVGNVLSVGSKVGKKSEWLLVTATGTYDPTKTITWRYRSNDRTDEAGIDVVVPFVTTSGTTLFVDRGFIANDGNDTLTKVPAPPTGTVTVEGYVRADGTGDSTKVDGSLNTRSLSSVTAAKATGLTSYGGWLQLKSEDPAPASAPEPAGLPDLGNGPHFFYGIQWWFFGLLAIVGFGYLLYDEYRLNGTDEEGHESEEAQRRRAEKSAKERERDAKVSKKKALKAAYQAAYERERSSDSSSDSASDSSAS